MSRYRDSEGPNLVILILCMVAVAMATMVGYLAGRKNCPPPTQINSPVETQENNENG